AFRRAYGPAAPAAPRAPADPGTCVLGLDFGSTTAKAVGLSPEKDVVFTCYAPSRGNPIEDAKALFRQVRDAGVREVVGVGITGYGAELLTAIIRADAPVVETVAHATAALHFFPDADCICDVGGTDVKIMLIRNGTVSDFRLNSQCSSGNGAFLQGVAERFDIALPAVAERAFAAEAMPRLTMGCGVFLQSDLVNQQRQGWHAEELLAALCAVLPVNVWVYAGGFNNLAAAGRKFILQGGTHRNLAVVKAQVDFIRGRIPDAEVVVHPYSGEAGAIGAALCALERWERGQATRFPGFDALERLTYRTTTSPATVCGWCPVHCLRTFIDAEVAGGPGRAWSKVPLAEGWARVISNNSCPKGLVEDATELRAVKAAMEKTRSAYPNLADTVRRHAFRHGAA
ncbi:MAG: BadF/BadG/BcrA/BcrD ATPase family protein, partial [Candidatus Rokuibacteriota bacterium]